MTAERPVPPGWTSRERLYPVGGVPGGDGAVLRSFVSSFADRVDGLDSAGPNAASYEELLFAYDSPVWRKRAADQLYSCARLGCVVLDCAGADVPLLRLPYQPRMGQAVADVVNAGHALGAWADTTVAGADLPTGPFVGLVGNNANEGAEHVIVGLDGLDDDLECRVVEGGQLSSHGKGYAIRKGFYEFERRDDVSVWARRISPSPNPWRRLRGYIDLEVCVFSQRATLPDDGPEAA